MSKHRKALAALIGLTAAASCLTLNPLTLARSAVAPTIVKDSIQVTLRTHRGFYKTPGGPKDENTWSWTPKIKFRVNGPITAGSQLSVEFTLPGNRPWVKFDCDTGEAKDETYWWETDCGNNLPDEKSVTDTGIVEFRIQLRNELAGTNATLFSGRMKVNKFHVGLDLPKFKNNFAYYVDYDWNLPIGYVFLEGERDAHSSRIDWSFPELKVAMWFRGNEETTHDVVAYLFYNGNQIGSTKTTDQGTETDDVSNLASESSPYEWRRKKFWFNTVRGWDQQPQYHIKAHLLNKNPGEYEVKVLQNGHLARVGKFKVGSDGKLTDGGFGVKNQMGNNRVVIPVQIVGEQDGSWDRAAWKTAGFYGNPLSDFVVPQ
jgi:hypothetical protein